MLLYLLNHIIDECLFIFQMHSYCWFQIWYSSCPFRRLATTKFEPTDARKALPCFDEPAMKATFSTVIVHDTDYTALSNMPVYKQQSLPNGRFASHFKKSVPMSTYLLAFIVCDFKYTNVTTGVYNNITVSRKKCGSWDKFQMWDFNVIQVQTCWKHKEFLILQHVSVEQ